jgi:hypothetical protein
MGNDFTKIPRPFYPPLSSHKREIRLLRLQPGDETLELQCRLSVVSINSNPLYEALSYTWGDLNNTSSIAVDGHDVLIPSNLEQALRKLRLNNSESAVGRCDMHIFPSNRNETPQKLEVYASVFRGLILSRSRKTYTPCVQDKIMYYYFRSGKGARLL